MTHYIRYCKHCGIKYIWQGSGHGCQNQKNTSAYCEGCQGAIDDALNNIPKKVKKKFIHTNEISFEEAISEIDKINIKMQKADDIPGRLPIIRRVFLARTKPETGELSKNREFIIKDIKYKMLWFESEPEKAEITKEVYWDLINNKELINY